MIKYVPCFININTIIKLFMHCYYINTVFYKCCNSFFVFSFLYHFLEHSIFYYFIFIILFLLIKWGIQSLQDRSQNSLAKRTKKIMKKSIIMYNINQTTYFRMFLRRSQKRNRPSWTGHFRYYAYRSWK